VIPVIESIAATHDVMISIDTYKPEVMRAAVAVGAHLINDVFALRYPGALEAAAALNVPVCLMHMQGIPATMQESPSYPNGVMHALHAFFSERVAACLAVGMPRSHLLLDPGFGFGKTVNDNLILTRNLAEMVSTYALPVMYGCSRKHSIGAILGEDAPNRLAGGLGLAVYAVVAGARIIRTHDVLETRHALKTVSAVLDGMN
jgi:dihydropteroate synthase